MPDGLITISSIVVAVMMIMMMATVLLSSVMTYIRTQHMQDEGGILTGVKVASSSAYAQLETGVEEEAQGYQQQQQQQHSAVGPSFILYYGLLDASSLSRILNVHPTMVILEMAGGQANDAIIELHKHGIKAIGSIAIDYGNVELDTALSQINEIMNNGGAGIFIDESQPNADSYLREIYLTVKQSYGQDKLVICNPGMIHISEDLMSICDILSFEHQWRHVNRITWFGEYPPERYMGLNSIGGESIPGGGVGNAYENLNEAHETGVQYQYTTYDFVSLPPWLDLYSSDTARSSTSSNNISAQEQTITDVSVPQQSVKVEFTTGRPEDMSGTHFVVKNYASNTTIYSGFTPAVVEIPSDITVEVTWFNPKGYTYESAEITGGTGGAQETFDKALGDPLWGGMQRFRIASYSAEEDGGASYTNIASYMQQQN